MNAPFHYDPKTRQLTGPAGTLSIAGSDLQATRFVMLVEGECFDGNITAVTARYGYSRQRYYQLRDRLASGGLAALAPQKCGPKSNYRRTDQVVRQVLRYRFLDPGSSPEVIGQKLRQRQLPISDRSVSRIIADYGIQKKTLHPGPPKPGSPGAYPTGQKSRPAGGGRPPKPGTGRAPTPGR